MSARYDALMGTVKAYWPTVRLYDRQREALRSLSECVETVIVAGNQLGKDYMAGLAVLCFFLWPQAFFPEEYVEQVERQRSPGQPDWQVHTRRIVTTSVDGDQLRNLWGEISLFVGQCSAPLSMAKGGPLRINMRDITLAEERETTGQEPLNYLIGRVTATGEGMSGAHAAYNLLVVDEASGSDDMIYSFAQGWAKKFLIFGNPNPTQNFFRKMVDGGDLDL